MQQRWGSRFALSRAGVLRVTGLARRCGHDKDGSENLAALYRMLRGSEPVFPRLYVSSSLSDEILPSFFAAFRTSRRSSADSTLACSCEVN